MYSFRGENNLLRTIVLRYNEPLAQIPDFLLEMTPGAKFEIVVTNHLNRTKTANK